MATTPDNPLYVKLHTKIASVLANLNASQGEIPTPTEVDKREAKNILDAIRPEIDEFERKIESLESELHG